jgi:exosortase family protein XrtF
MIIWLKQKIEFIPKPVQSFLIKALILFVIWKILYHGFLLPHRIPDTQLTENVARVTGYLYTAIIAGETSHVQTEIQGTDMISAIFIDGKRIIGIADGCNGFQLYIIYIGFIICIPTTIKRQLGFILGGVAFIYLINVVRCLVLAYMNMKDYPYFDFAHHFVFYVVVYGSIFYAWVLYMKKYDAKEE